VTESVTDGSELAAPAGIRDRGQRAPVKFGAVFAIVTAGIAVVNLDLFIVNVAIPSIARSFGGTDLSSLSWVLNAYAIVFAALLVPAGRAADLIGRRAAFLAGMVIFGVASAACAAAPDVWVLVIARVVQAAGGALLMPASLGLLLAAAPASRRVAMIRAWTSVGGAAAALGPVLGGALVAASWHWVFLVNVPVVVVAVAAGLRYLPADRASRAGTGSANLGQAEAEALPDVTGALLFTVAIGALALGLVKADDWGWTSPSLLGTLIGAAALLAVFARRSARHPAPVIEPHLLRQPVFAVATAANVLFGIAFGAMLLLVTLWCQDVWHWSALKTGLGIAPGPLLVPFWAIAAGPIARKIGPGPVAAVGCAAYAAGCVFWRLNLAVTPDYAARMLPGMLLTGTGVGLTLPSLVSAAVSAVPPQRFATGSGIVTMARQVGIVLGVAILVTVLGQPTGADPLPPFQHATVVLAVAAAAAGLVALLLIPAGRAVRRDDLPVPVGDPAAPPAG
jgi:EmrB/QacA subfamily drug resistance transporter